MGAVIGVVMRGATGGVIGAGTGVGIGVGMGG